MTLVQTVVLVGLVLVWGWVLGRPLLQSTFNRARRDPVGHFNRNMSVLGQAPRRSLDPGRGVATLSKGVGRPASSKKRRLQIFLALAISVVVSAAFALLFRGLFVGQLVVLAVALACYVGLATLAGAREAERGAKVRYLNAGSAAEPAGVRAVVER
ncbi:MAG: hypothetical protein O3C27_02945 [Actinomycetota bacterium]|nr:hypothetical protein [Actinomycetota bacterium]